jgi:hypothetical protein
MKDPNKIIAFYIGLGWAFLAESNPLAYHTKIGIVLQKMFCFIWAWLRK